MVVWHPRLQLGFCTRPLRCTANPTQQSRITADGLIRLETIPIRPMKGAFFFRPMPDRQPPRATSEVAPPEPHKRLFSGDNTLTLSGAAFLVGSSSAAPFGENKRRRFRVARTRAAFRQAALTRTRPRTAYRVLSGCLADFFRLSKSRCGLPSRRAPDRLALVALRGVLPLYRCNSARLSRVGATQPYIWPPRVILSSATWFIRLNKPSLCA